MGDTDQARIDQVRIDQVSAEKVNSPMHITQPPMYFIALCAADAASLPDLERQLWLFDDFEESVYQHYNDEIRHHMAAGGIIARLEEEIEKLKSQAGPETTPRKSWWRRLLDRP
ncbi:MAG: hypothetical protein GY732_04575 [Gammaproteobacteria bacterium]|nr:hypothetical protein [Gammaproteobacteria bacterium]